MIYIIAIWLALMIFQLATNGWIVGKENFVKCEEGILLKQKYLIEWNQLGEFEKVDPVSMSFNPKYFFIGSFVGIPFFERDYYIVGKKKIGFRKYIIIPSTLIKNLQPVAGGDAAR